MAAIVRRSLVLAILVVVWLATLVINLWTIVQHYLSLCGALMSADWSDRQEALAAAVALGIWIALQHLVPEGQWVLDRWRQRPSFGRLTHEAFRRVWQAEFARRACVFLLLAGALVPLAIWDISVLGAQREPATLSGTRMAPAWIHLVLSLMGVLALHISGERIQDCVESMAIAVDRWPTARRSTQSPVHWS